MYVYIYIYIYIYTCMYSTTLSRHSGGTTCLTLLSNTGFSSNAANAVPHFIHAYTNKLRPVKCFFFAGTIDEDS